MTNHLKNLPYQIKFEIWSIRPLIQWSYKISYYPLLNSLDSI